MKQPIDIRRTGVVVAYDPDSGEVLHVNEIFEEVEPGAAPCADAPGEPDLKATRELAYELHPGRRLEMLSVAERDAPQTDEDRPVSWTVDAKSRRLATKPAP